MHCSSTSPQKWGLFYFQKKSKLGVDNLRIILIIGGMSRNIDYATTATYRLRTLGSDPRIQSGWHDWDVKSQETFNRFLVQAGATLQMYLDEKVSVTVVVEIVEVSPDDQERVAWSMSVDQFHNQFLALEFTKMMFREKILI